MRRENLGRVLRPGHLVAASYFLLMPVLGCDLFESADVGTPDVGTSEVGTPDGGTSDVGTPDGGPQAIAVLGEGTVPAPYVDGQVTLGTSVGLAFETVGPSGGTIVASDGLTIEVPAGAHDAPVDYTVESDEILAHTFGSDFVAASALYHVRNGGVLADQSITVTIPVQLATDQFAMGFFYDTTTGRLEGMPLLALDETSVTITTRHFSDFLVLAPRDVGIGESAGVQIDTGFRPGRDDWQFPNAGSAIEPKGHCSGQSLTALWYFTEQRLGSGEPALWGRYDNTDGHVGASPWPQTTSFWQDDNDGYHLASTVQADQYRGGMSDHEWETMQLAKERWDALQYSAFILAMRITGEPQYVGVDHYLSDGTYDSGHAMVVYGATDAGLYVADPNFPSALRLITWDSAGWTLGPYDSLLSILDTRNISFEVVAYAAKSAVINWPGLGGRWSEFQAGTVGDSEFPNYTLMAQTTDGLGVTTSFDLTGDRVVTSLDEAELTVEVPGYDWLLTVYDGTTEIGTATSLGDVALPVILDDGDNDFGFLVEVALGGEWLYLDFDRLTLTSDVGLNEEMLPDEGEALAMGMLVKTSRTVEADPATGEVTRIIATYKAAPSADGEPDPGDVCMGAGPGGADAGFGPNLCLAVTLTLPNPPCDTCFNVDTVREEFSAPDPCYDTSDGDYVGFIRWPCVSSAGPVYDRGVQVIGFQNEDRNIELAHMTLRAEVMGVRIDISTSYRTYAAEQVFLDHIADVVSELAVWIAAEVRIQLE